MVDMTRQITIGPEFFAKAKNDYENFEWALVREFAQNSIDCGSSEIVFRVWNDFDSNDNVVTVLEVKNNGSPMTEDIIVNKLLCLGGSGKDFKGSVGGFGKAKELLYYSHNWYKIHSGDNMVAGSGAGYDIEKVEFYGGTVSTIEISGDCVSKINSAVRKFAEYVQWNGTLSIETPDGSKSFQCNNPKGTKRRDISFGTIYTNKSQSNICVVRIGGIPMFTRYCGIDRMVILELNGKSSEVLTSNRDGLVYPYSGQLSDFITELSVDKRRALKQQSVVKYELFAGSKLGHVKSQKVSELISSLIVSDVDSRTSDIRLSAAAHTSTSNVRSDVNQVESKPVYVTLDFGKEDPKKGYAEPVLGLNSDTKPVMFSGMKRVSMGQEFVIKNESGMEVPDYYRPTSETFSDYSKRLVRIWGRLMLQLHRLFDREDVFSIGFIFDDEIEAQHEKSSQYGRVYYIAPATIVEQSSSSSKSFKKKWKFDNYGRKYILSVAAHEFVHGIGHSYHSDTFANVYTEVMGKVMANMSDFTWCYKI
jgi:hypothetical protein